MRSMILAVPLAVLAPVPAPAQSILVTDDIATSTTWTSDNVYNLQDQIYVLPGATLTIEPGTVIASTTNLGGSLAVARGAQIFALGERGAPIIFTSEADVATWVGDDPTTGTWRESANEWGNLTLIGEAYISDDLPTNLPFPDPGNYGLMPGLDPPPGSTLGRYGGGDDSSDSGSLRFVSLRYSGRVIGLNNELAGLALGGVGRGTDIDHVEVMNGVDDGILILGGTVNIAHFSVWNVGDDSLDIDSGWRGKAQFGLIVQGYSLDASQGSGVGDNAIELDGAEAAHYQPVTTAAMYNLTVIGQPIDGDGLTAWRDNARVQFRRCVFMDCGEEVVRWDQDLPSMGYGAMGTLDWPSTWLTPHTQASTVNAPPNPAAFYRSQSAGNLIEFTDSVFFRNLAGNAYTEANARGVFAAGNENVLASAEPIAGIGRAPLVVRGGRDMLRVVQLDPRPRNDAVASATTPPVDSVFVQAPYRGAFSPFTTETWLAGWTSAEAFGFVVGSSVGSSYCVTEPNSTNAIGRLWAIGRPQVAANDLELEASQLPVNRIGFFLASRSTDFVVQPGGSAGNLCLGGAIGRYVGPGEVLDTGAGGVMSLRLDLTSIPQPTGPVAAAPGSTWAFQGWYRDIVSGAATSNFTNGVAVLFE